MSTPVVAVGAAAVGFYMYVRRWQQCGFGGVLDLPVPIETHARTEHAPTTWAETVYLFREALRYVYQETLGRWHAIDLFFGLAYISRRESAEHPTADIAAAGRPVCGGLTRRGAADLLAELRRLRRLMLYCQGLRHHGAAAQMRHWHTLCGTVESDVLFHSPTAGLLRPAFAILLDRDTRSLILVIRGTHSRPDMFTSLIGAVKPHHVVAPEGAVLGWSHLGMLAAARWVLAQTKYRLISALAQHPDYQLLVVGHSMGGGTAALLTMMVREKVPELAAARCYAIACPAVMTLELAGACSGAVTTLVHGADIVPTFSIGSVDALREEVTRSSWFADFQSDTRQRLYRALSTTVATATSAGGATLVAGCSGAGRWTARNILSPASKPFRSCWGPAPPGVGGPRRGGAAAAGGPGGGSGEAQPLLAGRGQAERYWQQQTVLQGAGGRAAIGRASPRPWGTAATGPGAASGDEGLADVGGGEVSGAAGGVPVGPLLPSGPELEAALQQCLATVEAGELGPQAAGALAAPLASEPFHRGLGGALPVSTRGGGGVGGASPPRGRTPVGGGVVGSVRAALVGKQRPAAPGKKDDDCAGGTPSGAPPGPVDGADGADSSAAAPFSAAVTLRRRGWTWQVLGPEAGGDGGAGGGGGWALEGGGVAGSMVQYVGRTSRLAAAAAGSLLRGGSVVLNACTPPTPLLAAGAGAGAGAGSAQQQQDGGSSGSRLGMGMGWLADFPGSPFHSGGGAGSSDGGQRCAPHAPDDGGGGDQGSDGSEGALDPDLDAEGGLAGDEEADAHELERPEVRQSISAVVATLVTADTGAGDAAARAEASAAEELLLEAADGGPGGGSSGGGSSRGQLLGAAGASPTRGGRQQYDGGNGSPPARGRGPDVASGDGGGATEGGAPSRSDDPRMVRRQMYPAGRILHLMPAHALRPHNLGDTQAQQQQQQQQRQSSEQQQPSRRTSQAGAVGGSGDYVLLEVPRREVYGRLRLCRSMIRDHFIPAYLRGLDAVAARLEARLAEGGDSA